MIIHPKSAFVNKIAEALGVSKTFRHIIIDIPYDGVTTIYIETLVEEKTFDVLPLDVEGMKVVRVNNK